MPTPPLYYPNFDWLRLAFAIQVVAIHSGGFQSVLINPVPAFIAVSGFVVLGSMERRPPGSFFLSRALRVLPLLIVSFLVIGALFGAAEMWHTVRFWIWPVGPAPINAVVWTLIYEEVFYVCMAALFAMGFYRKPKVLAIAFALSLWAASHPLGFLRPKAYVLISAFLLGSLVYTHRHLLCHTPKWLAGVVFAGVMAVAAHLPYNDAAWIDHAIFHSIVIFAALVFAIAGPQLPRLTVDISYSLYLFHCVARALLMEHMPLGQSIFFAMLASTIPVCLVAWYAVERPALSLRDRRLPIRRARPAASTRV